MRRNIIAASAIAVIMLVALLTAGKREKVPARPGDLPIPVERPVPPKAAAAPKPLGRYQPGARTPIPRFTVAPADAGTAVSAAAPGAPPPKLKGGGGDLRNKLEKTPPNFKETQVKVKDLLHTLETNANKCLAGYTAPDPALRDGVMLAIEIDKVGLQAVSIRDMVEIPDGPLRCLSNAAYELDWSGLTEEPVMITVPQKYAPTP